YTSDDKSIAKVSSSGKITAVSTGTVKIRVTTSSGQTDFVKVKVKKAVKSTAVSLGYTHKGTVTAGTLNVRKSASTSAAIITTLSKGTVITIKSTDSDWYKVTFQKSGKSYTGYVSSSYVTRVADITLKAGKTKALSATLSPSKSTDSVTYKSSDKSVAKVSSSGKITAVSAGSAVIRVTTSSGKTDFVKVKVT
ncbi:MAG: SH3 domain-containing protein, partial [Clostridiales bacterium]|nr:SH3 domain-containing protein [Clostridiales bacterium]